MSVTIEPSAALLDATRSTRHPRCVVCGREGPGALGLHFRVRPDGSVIGDFDCDGQFEGYGGMLPGGVISAIADGAMTNCLFAHGVTAVTAELNVRFRHPITLDAPLTVRARMARSVSPLFVLEADLSQRNELKVRATGKFMQSTGEVSA
jgi:acyl-coenzyme A thioesterase PaaI-like protein